VGVAVPPDTVAAVPIIVAPSNSWTCPVGVPPVTATLNENVLGETTFPLVTVNFVIVVVLLMTPPPLEPHPKVKLRMHTRPNPSAARYFLCPPGKNNRKSAAKPVPALSVHHPLPDVPGGIVFVGGIAFATNIRSSRALEAVKVVEVAVTMQFNVLATGLAATILMFSGEGVQLTPGGRLAAVGVTATVPVNPPVGVTVTVSAAAAPVDELSTKGCGLYDTVKLPTLATVTVTEVDGPDPV
jgi:hypothetical protein